MSSGAGWYSGLLSKTIGPIYTAATGVVDPWTKESIALKQAEDNLRAQGIDPATATADQWNVEKTEAKAEIDKTISSTPGPCGGVKPDDAMGGLLCSLQKFGIYVVVAIVILSGVYLYGKKLEGGGAL